MRILGCQTYVVAAQLYFNSGSSLFKNTLSFQTAHN
jgi:hypothetical protein